MGSEWMTNLPQPLRNIPLNQLAIPGSHDSAAHDLTTELSPAAPSILRFLSKIPCIHSLYKHIVLNMSTCQNLTFDQQIRAGIRHFDLRISTKQGSPDFFFVHSVYGSKIDGPLEEIRDFLEDYIGEVVILDFQQFYGMDAAQHQSLISLIKVMFGSKFCPRTQMSDLTLNSLRDKKKQVICIYQHKEAASDNDLWPSGAIESPWPNTTSPETCIDKLTTYMDQAEDVHDKFFVCQGVVTPDVPYILTHLRGGGVHKLTNQLNPVFNPWLNQSPNKWKFQPNVVIHDFVEEAGYIQHVVDLNKRRADEMYLDIV